MNDFQQRLKQILLDETSDDILGRESTDENDNKKSVHNIFFFKYIGKILNYA